MPRWVLFFTRPSIHVTVTWNITINNNDMSGAAEAIKAQSEQINQLIQNVSIEQPQRWHETWWGVAVYAIAAIAIGAVLTWFGLG